MLISLCPHTFTPPADDSFVFNRTLGRVKEAVAALPPAGPEVGTIAAVLTWGCCRIHLGLPPYAPGVAAVLTWGCCRTHLGLPPYAPGVAAVRTWGCCRSCCSFPPWQLIASHVPAPALPTKRRLYTVPLARRDTMSPAGTGPRAIGMPTTRAFPWHLTLAPRSPCHILHWPLALPSVPPFPDSPTARGSPSPCQSPHHTLTPGQRGAGDYICRCPRFFRSLHGSLLLCIEVFRSWTAAHWGTALYLCWRNLDLRSINTHTPTLSPRPPRDALMRCTTAHQADEALALLHRLLAHHVNTPLCYGHRPRHDAPGTASNLPLTLFPCMSRNTLSCACPCPAPQGR